MKIITYLGFTLLSILIQFCVMDFIQERLQLDKKSVDLNATSQRRQFRDVLKDIKSKPHALYYQKTRQIKNETIENIYRNTTLTDVFTTTEFITTELDVIFEDNSTLIDESYTTESLYTTSEYDNVTEITFFGKRNDSTLKPRTKPKKNANKECSCNFLYKVCDISCCCDEDCSAEEINLFPSCAKNLSVSTKHDDVCYSSLLSFPSDGSASRMLNSLFCIVKINLPDRRSFNYENWDQIKSYQSLAWKFSENANIFQEYSNKLYEYGDTIGILINKTITHIDIPSPRINSYCTGRKPILFLKDETFTCKVKLRDLEMIKFLRNSEYPILSATPLSINNTIMNCTNAYCANWTILICENSNCTPFNKTSHEPVCTERICENIALKLDYTFYYHDSKIINASMKFYVQNVSMDSHYLEQTVNVNFVLTNKSIEHILKLSGNPGYIEGFPVIVSNAAENFTQFFFNTTFNMKKHFSLPINRNAICVSTNTENVILFGKNVRISCKLNHKNKKHLNRTMECKNIQENILKFLGLIQNISISPLGNPQKLKDKDWILLALPVINREPIIGELYDESTKLRCYNVFTRFALIFHFASVHRNNKILSLKLDTTAKNISLNVEDISTKITLDISFIDVTKPSVYEYVSGPNLNFRLPRDFFYPFNYNRSHCVTSNIFALILSYCVNIVCLKIK